MQKSWLFVQKVIIFTFCTKQKVNMLFDHKKEIKNFFIQDRDLELFLQKLQKF